MSGPRGPRTHVKFTPKSKRQLIDGSVVAIESSAVLLLDPDSCPEARVQLGEMDAFEFQCTDSGNIRYGAPEGLHDDCVIGMALGVNGLQYAQPGIVVGRAAASIPRAQRPQGRSARDAFGKSWRRRREVRA